jgi:hypothetical protein
MCYQNVDGSISPNGWLWAIWIRLAGFGIFRGKMAFG